MPISKAGLGRKRVFQAGAFPPASLLFLTRILSPTPHTLPICPAPPFPEPAPGTGGAGPRVKA